MSRLRPSFYPRAQPHAHGEMIYNLYIFDRAGTCIYYTEWHRPVSTLKDLPDEDRKLMFGLLFSLKQLMNKANPMPCVAGAQGSPLH